MPAFRPLSLLCYALVAACCAPAPGTEPPPRDAPPGKWQLETVRLHDGKEYRGLAQDDGGKQFDFAEIVQPAGRPMYAVIRGIERSQVAELKRLPKQQHRDLEQRFRQFRNRAVIEAGRMEQVKLRDEVREGVHYRVYSGDWFELLTTTNDEAARQCVVRIEQIFRAYRTLLPPQVDNPPQRLRVQLYGSQADYRARLRQLGLAITNPACYVPQQHLILAGSELAPFSERLAQTRRDNENLRQQYTRLDGEFTQGLNRLSAELKENGFTPEEIAGEMRLRKSGWKAELDAMLGKISETDRRNAARFRDVTQQMFARLNHEAFHAYLDLHVYPHDRRHVPRWLNEGLAQVFESVQLDGEALRIDAADSQRLRELQADGVRLPLATLLNTSDQEFLAGELLGNRGSAAVQRTYLYSWALAYYLAFQEYRLTGAPMEEYVAPQLAPSDPLPRFEKLVDMPLGEFERRFRQTMLNLKR